MRSGYETAGKKHRYFFILVPAQTKENELTTQTHKEEIHAQSAYLYESSHRISPFSIAYIDMIIHRFA